MENVPHTLLGFSTQSMVSGMFGEIVEPAFGRWSLTGESESLGVALEALYLSPSFACALLDCRLNGTSNVTSCLSLLPLSLFRHNGLQPFLN